jgi:hypothetical protein
MERIVSPGVFMTENDLSYLPPAINEAQGVIIGPFLKGPAFLPTTLTSRNEAILKFGPTYDKFYTPYAVQEYLRNAGSVQVIRVLWEEGYYADTIEITDQSGDNEILCVLASTDPDNTGLSITWEGEATMSNAIEITISSSAGETGYTASLHSSDSNFIKNLFGTSPWGNAGVYVHSLFEQNVTAAEFAVTGSVAINGLNFENDSASYSEAMTPWVISQKVGGNSENLFKFHTLSDGDYTNKEIKVSIFDIKPASEIAGSDYGTFGVLIRDINDTDNSQKVLETFTECNLDPTSLSYVARKIGDRYGSYSSSKLTMYGNYEPRSNYVRVEVTTAVDNGSVSKNLVPFGFRAPAVPFSSSNNPPAMYYITNSLEDDSVSTKIYKGVDLHGDYENDNLQFLNSIPNWSLTGSNVDFHLEDTTSGSVSCSLDSGTYYKQFTIPLQGGFDGKSPSNKLTTDTTGLLMGFDLTSGTASGSESYKKALDAISNKDEVVMNLLAAPGINLHKHSHIYTYAKNICEDRGDTFFIVDTGYADQTVANAVEQTITLDSSYAATYYPWVKIKDANTNRYVWVPPSVVIPGVIAFNDKVGYEWYAPAGLNRGGLTSVIETKTRLTHLERDDLYSARINPIASFPEVGAVVWGQKTLQALPSATDRVNVRRLLIKMKEFVNRVSKRLNFQMNTNSERQKWVNTITPYMESIQQKNGLYAFKVVMDDTNNTADDIDRNIMRGEIWIQPSRVAEFISIEFNITRTGAVFGN